MHSYVSVLNEFEKLISYVTRIFIHHSSNKIIRSKLVARSKFIKNLAMLFLYFPVAGYSNSCPVENLAQWNALGPGSSCTHVSFEGNTIVLDSATNKLLINNEKFPSKITLTDGTIDGADTSVENCIEILHSNIELKNIEVKGCGRHGIQIGQENASQDAVGRKIYLEKLKLSDIGMHGIYIGRHNHPHPVDDIIRVTETVMENIGVDGIAGSIGPNGILDVDNSDFSLLDQRGKRRLGFNQGLPAFCKHPDLRTLGGDCVHLQPVQGIVNIEGNRCDHTDMPTKNGFILQNQNVGGNSSGTANVSNNQVLMNRSCLDVTGHSTHVNIRPNGIQLENIENIRVADNEISRVVNGISLNGNWLSDTCSLMNNQITSVLPESGQEMAGVHFSGGQKNCNADATSAVPIDRGGLPGEDSVQIVFTRIDLDPTEYRWIAADDVGILGHTWIEPVCGQQLANRGDLDQGEGDWNTMDAMYPGGEPVEPPPCPTDSALVVNNFHEMDSPQSQRPERHLSLIRQNEHDALAAVLSAKILLLKITRLEFELLKLRTEIEEFDSSVKRK